MKINEKNLCVFARTPPYDMEGFLYKRGEVNKAFQRRYFVLKGNLLFYFETRLDKEPLGLIIVEGCTIELSLEPDVDNYCFKIVFNGNRSYILAADTQESMELWMKALTCAGYEYKRIIVSELQRQLQEIEDSRKKVNDDSSAPKPPPRGRINPFNRPAPPVPSTVMHEVEAIPFANGHFGSSKAQQELSLRENGNGSPHRIPKPLVPPRGASPSVFYADSPETVLPHKSNINTDDTNSHAPIVSMERRRQRLALAMELFQKEHEAYRKEVMPDIVAYRRTRKQPLIQF